MKTLTLGRRATLAIAGAATVVTIGASAAFAATSLSQSTGLTDGQSITVSGSGLTANAKHKVGVCSTETYGILGVPACASGVEVTTNSSGAFSVSINVDQTNTNAHYGIPVAGAGQPSTFTCNGSGEDDCEVLITRHNGLSSTTVGEHAISFQ